MKTEYITLDKITDNKELVEILCIDTSNEIEYEMSDYWLDCDYVKIEGEQGRGGFEFITVKSLDGETQFCIVNDYEIESGIQAVLDWFFEGHPNEIEIENNWQDWNKVFQGVAYRGGSGYCYGLYAKELGNLT